MLGYYLSGFKTIFNAVKKIFLISLVFFIVINLFLYFINKNRIDLNSTDQIKNNRKEIYKVLKDPQLNGTKEGKAALAGYRIMACTMMGEACTDNPEDGEKNYSKTPVGLLSSLIALPYTSPPASGFFWAVAGLQNVSFIPKTYAAEGIGFAAIKPVMKLWIVFRDASYMLLVLILIVIGFMIMFRMKLNPQTVISIENALPRIVIALLLITFSFAIAGFLIDIMYVIIALGISLVAKSDSSLTGVKLHNQYISATLGTLWDSMFPKQGGWSQVPIIGGMATLSTTGEALLNVMPGIIDAGIRVILGFFLLDFALFHFFDNVIPTNSISVLLSNLDILGNSFGKLPEGIIGLIIKIPIILVIIATTLVWGGGWIVGILIFFTILFMLFRIFVILFTTYLRILFLIIFSPIILLFEALPGKNAFGFWFKSLFADLLTFPTVIMLLVIGRVLVNLQATSTTGILWQPPFLGGIDPKSFSVLLGMGIIFMIPELTKLFKELLGVKGLPVGLTLGTFFAGVGAGAGGAITGLSTFGSLTLAAPGLRTVVGRFLPFLRDTRQAGESIEQQILKLSDEQIANIRRPRQGAK